MMILFTVAVLLMFGSGTYKYWMKERELQELRERNLRIWNTNRQVQRTLATGLYHRFGEGQQSAGIDSGGSSIYIRSSPYEFAYFVADLLEGLYGGQSYVVQSDDPAGIDIEHERRDGLYLIQVRSNWEDTDADAVAILHSQVVKRRAQAGWIVSTGGFTESAKRYAEETELVWVDGIRLVQLWSEYLESMERRESGNGQQESLRPVTV
ncbi:restriction endonuclease [Gorillibacterium sp. sgz5001074]|uniref:restriction endonuclease n=1 Tax=Gorillibacterium sp. sgz5001074 TaxID=3446695 RepID=UPI003F666173